MRKICSKKAPEYSAAQDESGGCPRRAPSRIHNPLEGEGASR